MLADGGQHVMEVGQPLPQSSSMDPPARSYPAAATVGRSANMRANRRADTKPERLLRSALHSRGLRFRKDFPVDVPGCRVRPDVVFTRQRVAVFIDGCFWHCCPEHGRVPASNEWYWSPKLARNRERDREVVTHLQAAGWLVRRYWEHEDVREIASEVEALVRAAQAPDSPRS